MQAEEKTGAVLLDGLQHLLAAGLSPALLYAPSVRWLHQL